MSKDIEIMLFQDLVQIIEQGKNQLAKQVNSTIALVYWHIGKRINKHVLDNKRAEYGKKILSPVATKLSTMFGRSFEERNLRRMMQFADEFTDITIVTSLMTKLISWPFCPEGINIHRKTTTKQVCPSGHKHLQLIPYREIDLRDLPFLWKLISSGENSIDGNWKPSEHHRK